MGNSIKYNTNSESKALKVNNFWFGTGDVDKGPTSTTGFYNSINPPSNGYTIYLNKVSGGPSIYVASNDAQLIDLTNKIANTNYTGVTECFNYFRGQSDKVLFNRKYESIVTDGLILNVDAGFVGSYPQSGTTIYDLSGNENNGTLISGTTFDTNNGGSLVFNGIDNYVNFGDKDIFSPNRISVFAFTKTNDISKWAQRIVSKDLCCDKRDFGLQFSSNNRIQFTVWNESGQIGICEGGDTVGTGWNMVGGTWDGSIIKTFINGVQQASLNLSGTSVRNTASDLMLGIIEVESPYSQQAHLDGNIGNFLIYNRALSGAEILQNYNALKGRFGL